MILFASSYRWVSCFLIAFFCGPGSFGFGITIGHTHAETDSISYYQEKMTDAGSPEELEKARSWLNGYYRARVNYDEEQVPVYDLPEVLMTESGSVVDNTDVWISVRRPEIKEMFKTYVYGRVPEFDYEMTFKTRSVDPEVFEGTATRKQVAVFFDESRPELSIEILIYLPNHVQKPVPAIMGLNFSGNHTIHRDEGILISEKWMNPNERIGIRNNRATAESRGASGGWEVERILQRGYALVTAYRGDIEPDRYNMMAKGVRSLAYDEQTEPAPDEWGAVAAWAWGLSRMMDYLEADDDIDHQRTAVMGHSRLGKAALWAGASDDRFALVISNNSGCGGAALSLRRFGETIGVINTSFPHWFGENFNQFNGREEMLPVDQHMLLSLIAPRPLYVASAEDDRWADPKGEFLAIREASPVYELFGLEGLPAVSQPDINSTVMGTIGYHIRSGRHSVTSFDWEAYLDFADMHIQDDSSAIYLQVVREYADTMIEYGRDRYGEVHSPLFAVTLDRKTLSLPEGESLEEIQDLGYGDWGVRYHDRILDGANTMRHQNLYQTLYALTDATGDTQYAEQADSALIFFFQNAQSEATGLMAWGDHAGWSFNDNGPTGMDIHEFSRPWILWPRTFYLVPEQAERFAKGLWNHQIGDQESGAFSRHAKLSKHGPGTGHDFPRHAGFFIDTWTEAYSRTGDPTFVKAITTLLDFFDRHSSEETGAIPAEVDHPRSNSVMLWPQSNLSMAIDLWRSAGSGHLPDELNERMRLMALQIDDVYHRLPHNVHEGGGFVQRSHIHTLEAVTLLDEHGSPYTDRWGGAYGHRATVKVANKCLLRYRQTGNEAFRQLVLDAARQYLDSVPDQNQVVYPGTVGDAIFLMAGAYELSGDERFLDRADYFGQLALTMFFDSGSPLPRATSVHDHYEANINRPDTLMMALLKLWAILNEQDENINLIWIDR